METETKILQDKIKELSSTIILLSLNIDKLVSDGYLKNKNYDALLSEFQKVRAINMELEKKNDKVKEHVMALLKEIPPYQGATLAEDSKMMKRKF